MQFRPLAAHQTVLDQATQQLTPTDQISIDMEAGDAATVALFHLKAQGRPLHNLSFLLDGSSAQSDVLVLTCRRALEPLRQLGQVSEVSPGDPISTGDPESTSDELMLCRVRVNPALCRRSVGAAPMTLAQALRRESGPWLLGMHVSSRIDVPGTMLATGEAAAVRR